MTIPRGSYDDLSAELVIPSTLEAPVAAGAELGELLLTLGDEEVHRAPLVALAAVEEAGLFSRLADWVSLFFADLFS